MALRSSGRQGSRPILTEPWILDADTTIKPLYGHQEGAEVGYNPHKPGRPSHAYHSFAVAGVRLVLDGAVDAGNRHRAKHAGPPLWNLLGRLPRSHWPSLVRGDRDWGSEPTMASCEQRGVDYLFKLRMTRGVRQVVEKSMDGRWEDAGQGWSGREGRLRLSGWSRSRRVVLLRRRLPDDAVGPWCARPPMARAICSGRSPEEARWSGSSPCW
ncbi:MAG TPA: transposase [Actinomycetota bacterium]|nr:transposase [Actinomycetota bacterium]